MRFAALLLFVSVAVRADDLAPFVRSQLEEHGVPGAAVVVIRSGAIASETGFGVRSSITRRPVTPQTAFPVASNGKPVAARIAVKTLGNLEQPVFRDAVTPLHLLTHTSGLGNFLRDRRRRLAFRPGERFAYSGVGFVVLQEVLESRTGRSLDDLAREHVFRPAGMTRSWFGSRPAVVDEIAAPHVPLLRALAPFTILAAPAVAVLGAVLYFLRKLNLRTFFAVAAAVAAGTFAFLWNRSGSWVLGGWFTVVPLALLVVIGLLMRCTRPVPVFIAAVLAVAMARQVPVPLPTMETGPANAASSLRATASDLARFLLYMAKNEEMTRIHRTIDAKSAWGLGIGIERHARGSDLWHWGSNPGAKSLMIYCPETGDGVVVVTNGSEGSGVMRNVAERVLGRSGCWRPGCS